MSSATIALLVLVAAVAPPAERQAAGPVLPAGVDRTRSRPIGDPDSLSAQNDIEIAPSPAPLPPLTPVAPEYPTARLNDELRSAFPAAVVRLDLVGERLVLTGRAADADEAGAILELVRAASAGRRVVNRMRVRGQVLLHVLAVEVDRQAALAAGLTRAGGIGEQGRTADALAGLCARGQAAVLAGQTIPANEGENVTFSFPRCQVALRAARTPDAMRLGVSAKFGPSQSVRTVVDLRTHETMVLTSYTADSGLDLLLIVTPELVSGMK